MPPPTPKHVNRGFFERELVSDLKSCINNQPGHWFLVYKVRVNVGLGGVNRSSLNISRSACIYRASMFLILDCPGGVYLEIEKVSLTIPYCISHERESHRFSPAAMVEHTKVSSVQQNSPGIEEQKPPNGGLVAWLQVLAGHLIFFNTWYVV